ncbi:hypothetical protein LA080_009513 [Diaporthe eres]|uniref:Uncharacterized protein n=1 Tax=Diaporthe vaccinii TaxID=105482 RepID=A0ABR4DPT5_9PEZI|nr:hypothetical protein LA080_009513 [Diaporthe eres]
MGGHLADTQSCDQQQDAESLPTSLKIPELTKAEITKHSIDMDAETTENCQQQTLPPDNAEHQTTTPTSPTIESIPLEDQNVDIEPLLHFYSCCKLSFLIKMALLQNVKALGYAMSEEDLEREEESVEIARAKALEVWEKIHDRGFSYDVNGSEYLRTSTLH